jgi:hypothetical protein
MKRVVALLLLPLLLLDLHLHVAREVLPLFLVVRLGFVLYSDTFRTPGQFFLSKIQLGPKKIVFRDTARSQGQVLVEPKKNFF